jgi:hypothetical protein
MAGDENLKFVETERNMLAPCSQLQAVATLHGTALLATSVLEVTARQKQVPEQLHDLAVTLHDNCLLCMLGVPGGLTSSVLRLCARWWELDAPGRADLIAQTLPYLLVSVCLRPPLLLFQRAWPSAVHPLSDCQAHLKPVNLLQL